MVRMNKENLAFGFMQGRGESLRDRFNEAIQAIKAAVTGDIPPIDYVAMDGEAAGFNTALLAEIAKRLRVNVKTVYVNTASRTASLSSGRSDVVFWYQVRENAERQPDVPDSVILSEPYYDWNTFVHIGRKNAKPFNDD